MTLSPRKKLIRPFHRQKPEWITLDFGVSKEVRKMVRRHL